jgi:hypothetical protein
MLVLSCVESSSASGKCTPATWWGGLCSASPLQSTAKKLLTVPPTSAAAERNFSSFATIHTKKRNRLTTDRAGKLVYVYHNLRCLRKTEYNDLTDAELQIEDTSVTHKDLHDTAAPEPNEISSDACSRNSEETVDRLSEASDESDLD